MVLVGVYGARYNMFPLGDFFARNITLKMGQRPAHTYGDDVLRLVQEGKFDPTEIITHTFPLRQGKHAYEIFDAKYQGGPKAPLKYCLAPRGKIHCCLGIIA